MNIPVTKEITPAQKIDVRTVGQKRRDTLLAEDPDYFKRLGHKGGKNGGRPFKSIDGLAKKAADKRWHSNKGDHNAND